MGHHADTCKVTLLGKSHLNMLHDAERGPGGYSSRKVLVPILTALKNHGISAKEQPKKPTKYTREEAESKVGNVTWGYADSACACLHVCRSGSASQGGNSGTRERLGKGN